MSGDKLVATESLFELYVKACCELFSTYCLQIHIEQSALDKAGPGKQHFVSALGATGENIRLMSTLNIDVSLLASMYPLGSEDTTLSDLEDWCRELNNQLVGRLKNKLLVLGCEVMVGLPSLISDSDSTTVSSPDQEARECFFASAEGSLSAQLALIHSEHFKLGQAELSSDSQDVKLEGTHLIF